MGEMALAMGGLGFGDQPREEIEKMIRSIDTDANGLIEYPEFEKMMKAKMAQKDSPEEIFKAFARLLGENPGDDVLQEMIAEADEDRDGEISFEEFKNVMLQMRASRRAPL